MMGAPLHDFYEPPGEPGFHQFEKKPKFVLEAYEDINFVFEEEWLVKHMLPREGVAVIFGQSGSFKSFVTSDAGWHVAAGRDWAGRRTIQTPVVYIAAEGARGLRKRKVGFAKSHPDFPSALPFRLVSAAPNLGGEQGDLPELIAAIESAEIAPGFIIIDTLAQTLGSGDENGSGMIQFIANANELARQFKALVLVVHHCGLSDDQRLRGHSSLKGALDAQIICERVDESMTTTLKLQKLKDEDTSQKFNVHMVRVVIGHDEDGDEVSTLTVESIDEANNVKAPGPRAKAIPASRRMLMDAIVKGVDDSGIDFRPFGTDGPPVRAAAESAIQAQYQTKLAEKAEPDEDPKLFADRQRKSFKRAITAALDMKLIAAVQHRGERLIWII